MTSKSKQLDDDLTIKIPTVSKYYRLRIYRILLGLDRLLFTRNKNGLGKRSHLLGSVYEGYWVNGKYHGEGSLTWPSTGVTYKGQFIKGSPNGKGTITDKLGNFYDGEWLNGTAHGFGIFKLMGLDFEGEFQNGKVKGKGTIKFCRHKYVGGWKDNRMHGIGTYTWPSGASYCGEFKNNKMHGRGWLKQTNGCVVEGKWKKGALVSRVYKDDDSDDTTLPTIEASVGIPVSKEVVLDF